MKVDAKKVLKELKEEKEEKKPVTVYLNAKNYETFKKCCGEAPASKVLDKLIKQFIDSAKK